MSILFAAWIVSVTWRYMADYLVASWGILAILLSVLMFIAQTEMQPRKGMRHAMPPTGSWPGRVCPEGAPQTPERS